MSKDEKEWLGPEWDLKAYPASKREKDEPATWDGEASLRVVGQPIPRLDGEEKVTGRAHYTTDIQLPEMLHAVVIRSPIPSGKLLELNVDQVRMAPGVEGVIEVAAPGAVLRYEGQPIAAIAARSPRDARRAARLAVVRLEQKQAVLTVGEATAAGAPLVFNSPSIAPGKGKLPISGNLRGPATGGRRFASTGSTEKGIQNAHTVVEHRFTTAVQTHSCLEPHGSVVEPLADGGMNIWTSTQSISSVVRDVARAFNIPRPKVRVRAHFVGGGFGSKFGAGQHTLMAARLARETGKPVRLILDRREEHLCGGNRPSSVQSVKMGFQKDGTLTAIDLISHGSAGVGTGAGVAAPFHMIYACENRQSREFDVFTNTGAAAAFRAPGHPQGVFALEGMMDEAAQRLEIDPIVLRLKNDVHPVRREQWKRAMEQFDWVAKRKAFSEAQEGTLQRGVGAAASVWYNIVQKKVSATVELFADGTARVLSGVQDIGGGIRTVVAQVAAEALYLPVESIAVELGDSHFPEGPGSGGSKTTSSLAPAVHQAAHRVVQKLAEEIAPLLGAIPEKIRFERGVFKTDESRAELSIQEACARLKGDSIVGHGERKGDRTGITADPDATLADLGKIIAGVQLVQVAVDCETGVVHVEDVLAIQDCGRVINPLQARGQVNGGVIQGLSYALFEERTLDPLSGLLLNGNLETYRIAGVADLPPIRVDLMNTYTGRNSTGAMGLGEPTTVPTAAAIRNAIFHATGAFLTELPMTPQRVLAALKERV